MQKQLLLGLVLSLFSFTACSSQIEETENTSQDNTSNITLSYSEAITNSSCNNTNDLEIVEEKISYGDAVELKDIHMILNSLKWSYSFTSTDDDVITFFSGKVQGALTIEPYYNDNSKLVPSTLVTSK